MYLFNRYMRLQRRILSIAISSILVMGLASCGAASSTEQTDSVSDVQASGSLDTGLEQSNPVSESPKPSESGDFVVPAGYRLSQEKTNYVAIQMDSGEVIVIELKPDVAPITVENFQNLVSQQFYDGLIFHRVIQNFMIQGGDPKGNGTGGAPHKIKGEFASNGVQNTLSHVRGVVSMARAADMDSASSQFFICHADSTFLDGDYAAFGVVVDGMETVDTIAKTKTNAQDLPIQAQVMRHVFFVDKG